MGEDLQCCSNKIKPASLRECPHDHQNTDKAYLNDIRVTNISKSFTHKMAAKTSWHRYGTKLRHCHRMYTGFSSSETLTFSELSGSLISLTNLGVIVTSCHSNGGDIPHPHRHGGRPCKPQQA